MLLIWNGSVLLTRYINDIIQFTFVHSGKGIATFCIFEDMKIQWIYIHKDEVYVKTRTRTMLHILLHLLRFRGVIHQLFQSPLARLCLPVMTDIHNRTTSFHHINIKTWRTLQNARNRFRKLRMITVKCHDLIKTFSQQFQCFCSDFLPQMFWLGCSKTPLRKLVGGEW